VTTHQRVRDPARSPTKRPIERERNSVQATRPSILSRMRENRAGCERITHGYRTRSPHSWVAQPAQHFVVRLGVDAVRATKTWPSCAFRSARSAHLLPIRSAAMDFAPVWSPRLLRTESAGRRREAKLTDKQHLRARAREGKVVCYPNGRLDGEWEPYIAE
jgi:hypothetical protein